MFDFENTDSAFFYCFSARDDYGVRALQSILDMVKVMDFALLEGKVCKMFSLIYFVMSVVSSLFLIIPWNGNLAATISLTFY